MKRAELLDIERRCFPSGLTIDEKYEVLLRWHRQLAVDSVYHERAILSLKQTATAKRLARERAEAASIREGERLARMGY